MRLLSIALLIIASMIDHTLPNAISGAAVAVRGSQPSLEGCTGDEVRALQTAVDLIAQGDDEAVRDAVDLGVRGPADPCQALKMSRAALGGWEAARRAAAGGGAPDLLVPASRSLDALEELRRGDGALDAEYAQTAVRAAMAAAQDERPEMALLLTHARDLSERLALRGRRAVWPRSFNVLAGELWLEVDRYEDARAAFERAAAAQSSPLALVGLARSLARLGDHDLACETFRRVHGAATSLLDRARGDLAACR
jgi:tetratricopeptide (TPR) repeat protein